MGFRNVLDDPVEAPTKEEKLVYAQAKAAKDTLVVLSVLSRPISPPKWVTGDTWALMGLCAVSVGMGLLWIWAIPLAFGIAVLYGASKRKEREVVEWENETIAELQRLLVWTTHNRNSLAELTEMVYTGAIGDDNNPWDWVPRT